MVAAYTHWKMNLGGCLSTEVEDMFESLVLNGVALSCLSKSSCLGFCDWLLNGSVSYSLGISTFYCFGSYKYYSIISSKKIMFGFN